MSLFVCAKCGCVDNTATSSYWMLTNEYMVDKFDYAKELQPYKGMGLCSECGRLATSPDGRDVVVPGKWHGKFPKKKATEEQLKKVEYKRKKGSSPTPIRRRRKTSGVSIWMWMILSLNIKTDNENKKDRMIIAYPSIIM